MKPSDSWLEIANQLAKLGKLSLIKTNGKPSDSFNSKKIYQIPPENLKQPKQYYLELPK